MAKRLTKSKKEVFIIIFLSIVVYLLAAKFDILENIVAFSSQHERYELDEIITVFVFLAICLAFYAMRRWRELVLAEKALLEKNRQLNEAIAEIIELKGIIPICSYCKSIRDDKGVWSRLEQYIKKRYSDVEFSHGICDACLQIHYPEVYNEKK